jgi:hypothetical protein
MLDDLKDKNSEAYKAKLKIALKAFETGSLIVSTETQKWYTPREFMECNERVQVKTYGMQEYSNFTLHYAQNAIKKKLEDLHRAQAEFDAIVEKVLTAFELHPKKAMKK